MTDFLLRLTFEPVTCVSYKLLLPSLISSQRPDFDPDSSSAQEAAARADSEAAASALNYAALEKAVRAADKAGAMLKAVGMKEAEAEEGEQRLQVDQEEKDYIVGEAKNFIEEPINFQPCWSG